MALPIEPWPQQYSRRHTVCKAWRVDADNLKAVAEWVGGGAHTWAASVVVPLAPKPGALEGGEMVAHPGDWIVQVGPHFSVWVDELFAKEWVPEPTARPHVYEWHPGGEAS